MMVFVLTRLLEMQELINAQHHKPRLGVLSLSWACQVHFLSTFQMIAHFKENT